MPKWRKITKLFRLYSQIYRVLMKTELELHQIIVECPEKTSSYLHYGRGFRIPYSAGDPVDLDSEDWQFVLANLYAQEANRLLEIRERELKRLHATASRIYALRGRSESVGKRFPHLRAPWFETTEDVVGAR